MDVIQNKVNKIVSDRNLCSYMNTTKWNEFFFAVRSRMPFMPPFDMKFLTEDSHKEADVLFRDVFYCGDWNGENFPGEDCWCNIEWVKVRPRYLKYRGRLVNPEVIDATEVFIEILKSTGVSYEERNGLFSIYGYR